MVATNDVDASAFERLPGGNVMVLPMDHRVDEYSAERLRAADTLLLGRTSYEGFKGLWPGVGEDPKAAAEQFLDPGGGVGQANPS